MQPADIVLRGGSILTLDAQSTVHEAIALRGEHILATGGTSTINGLVGPQTRIIELAGRTALPGFTDGHAHLDREGLKGLLPSVSGCASIDDLVARLGGIAADVAPGTWIVTMPLGEPPEYRWSTTMFAEGRLPDRHDLDRASSSHPILIRCAWGYWTGALPLVTIANSAALALAGVGRATASPSALLDIERDGAGEPTGRFFENAFQPIAEFTLFRAAPHFTRDDRARTLARSMQLYNQVGTTSVFEGHGAAGEVIDAYRALRRNRRSTVRASLVFSPGGSGASADDVERWVRKEAPRLTGLGEGDDWYRLAGVFAEPETAGHEARLRARCAPQTGWAGFLYDSGLPAEALTRLLGAAARERLRVCGIQMGMLDLYAAAARVAPIDDLRWVIAHPVTVDAVQLSQLRALGICITTHTNAYLWKRGSATLARIGPDKAGILSPVRAMLDAGLTVSLATDNVPVSLWNCVWQAHARTDRATGEVLGASQCITREEALRCATVHGARLCLAEDRRGTLEAGKLADLQVLPDDPRTCSTQALRDMRPDVTIAGGRVVWDRIQGDKGASL